MRNSPKTFLVTGATKGIGLAISQQLIEQGHTVVGIARNPAKDFAGHLYLCDLADESATQAILEKIAARHSIDGIVNNAGITLPESIETLDLNKTKHVLALNVLSAIQIVQFFLPTWRTNRWGRVVNISSRAIRGALSRTSYSAAKSALIGCTRTWALEMAESGITVNAVAPGPTETELYRQHNPIGGAGDQQHLAKIPMKRLGKPEEIAAVVTFLLSEPASYVTGQVIFVDGGRSIY